MIRTLRRLIKYRHLLVTLTQRELSARYRGSVLGFLWSLVNPILLLVVYSFVFNTIFKPRDPTISDYGPYALFLATGVIPWIWIQTAWLEGTMALLANAGLIRKATFPAELLPMVSVAANLVQFVLALPVLAMAFLVTGWVAPMFSSGSEEITAVTLNWTVLFLPVITLLLIPLVSGVTLAFAALNVHFKDVRDILQNLLTLLFFMTPILYSLTTLEPYRLLHFVVLCNPFTPFMLAYQEAVFFGRVPGAGLWLHMVLVAWVTGYVGAWMFDRLSETLVEAV